MGQFGMLDCANNFANKYGGKQCRQCGTIDDESHRINNCPVYASINLHNNDTKVNFDDIFCESDENVMHVVRSILSMWDLERGNNERVFDCVICCTYFLSRPDVIWNNLMNSRVIIYRCRIY